jgi:hypothetical protein
MIILKKVGIAFTIIAVIQNPILSPLLLCPQSLFLCGRE